MSRSINPVAVISTTDDKNLKNELITNLIQNILILNHKYRSLYENSPDLLRTVNTEGIILDCNKTYAEQLGYLKKELIGTSIFDTVAPSSLDALHDSLETWTTRGEVKDREIFLKRRNGSVFPCLLSANNLYDEDGKIIGSNTIIKNISDIYEARKKIEANQELLRCNLEQTKKINRQLLSTEQKYKNLYEKTPALLRTITIDGIITNCNDAYAKVLGYTKEETLGMSIYVHTAERSLKDMKDNIENWKETHEVSQREIWLKRKDGSIFLSLLNGGNIYDQHGNVIGRTVALTDITEIYEIRKRLGESAIELKKQLMINTDLAKDKEEYLTWLSQEVRSAAISISNSIGILLSEKIGKINGNQLEIIENIITRSKSMVRMLTDISEAQKIEHRMMILSMTQCNLSKVIANTIFMLKKDLDFHGCKVTTELKDISCFCDRSKIENVLTHILYNAIDFSPKGISTILVKLDRQDNYAKIIVKDNGIGIQPDKLDKIFGKFYQLRTDLQREHGGAGLGMYICKGLIESHGGKIWAESKGRNAGTEIHIQLPLFNNSYSEIKKIE